MTYNTPQNLQKIRESIRNIENYPEPGIMFRDITTLLQSPEMLKTTMGILIERYKDKKIDAIIGLDARGFIFGPILAYELGISFVPIRKKGKLPYQTISVEYSLEYGDINTVEIHTDAVNKNDNVDVIDELIATGGTMLAACDLLTQLGANVMECSVISDLAYLPGSDLIKSKGYSVFAIVDYKC